MSKYVQKYPVPLEFPQILNDFAKELLRDQPEDIYEFGYLYFKALEEGQPFDYPRKGKAIPPPKDRAPKHEGYTFITPSADYREKAVYFPKNNQRVVHKHSQFTPEEVCIFSKVESSEILEEFGSFTEMFQHPERLQYYLALNAMNVEPPIQPSPYKLLVVVGPSGVGKGTLIRFLTEKYPNKFGFSVSYTTRAMRPGEAHGVNYFYVSQQEFQSKVDKNEFAEYFQVHNHMYGTEKKQLEQFQHNKVIPLLDIDIQGAMKVNVSMPGQANFIFVCPPSIRRLEEMLRGRGTETEEQVRTRLQNAASELELGLNSPNVFTYRVINDEIEESAFQFVSLVENLYMDEL